MKDAPTLDCRSSAASAKRRSLQNWPAESTSVPSPNPVECMGGLLFSPWQRAEAHACATRTRGNGHAAVVWTYSGDRGIFVEITP